MPDRSQFPPYGYEPHQSQGHSTDGGMTWTHTCIDCSQPWPCPDWLAAHPGTCGPEEIKRIDAQLRAAMARRN